MIHLLLVCDLSSPPASGFHLSDSDKTNNPPVNTHPGPLAPGTHSPMSREPHGQDLA